MYKSSADPPEGGFKGGPGAYVNVAAPTLFLSLIILFAMIALVIVTIMINGWKLTKTLGITMIGFYVCFVAQASHPRTHARTHALERSA
jgi:ABC-type transport system involved in Fe-S cluster assembly fused permease/ATPase subunit